MSKDAICPVCSQSDQVEKVSTIYISGIGLNRSVSQGSSPDDGRTSQASSQVLAQYTPAELRALSRRLKPPSMGKRSPFPALHPDLIVLTFSLILPIFLYGILTSQPEALLPMAVLLVGLYGLYLWKRKALVIKFEIQRNASRAAQKRVEQSVGRWMKLYYCARDDCVFQPGTGSSVPADQMPGYLMQTASNQEE